MSEEAIITDWWEVFRVVVPWGIVLFLTIVDLWIITRLRRRNHELRIELRNRGDR